MAMVQERLNANRPQADTKGGKLAPGAVNNNKDLDVDVKKEEPSFFGSFFSQSKNAPKKKGAAVMDAVSFEDSLYFRSLCELTFCTASPADPSTNRSQRSGVDGDRGH
jgi:hypothetical protein